MSDAVLLEERAGAVALLTLNRPDKLNALDLALSEALVAAFEALDGDETVRAIVLAGAGRAFSAGADLKEFAAAAPASAVNAERRSRAMRRLNRMIRDVRQPVIAAVGGFALGGGCALALACDMVLAGRGATFGYPELRHGIVPAGVLPSLVSQAGARVAFDLIATGRRVEADEARALGLINRVVDDEAVLDEAMEMAGVIAGYPPEAMAEAKALLHALADRTLDEGLEFLQRAEDAAGG